MQCFLQSCAVQLTSISVHSAVVLVHGIFYSLVRISAVVSSGSAVLPQPPSWTLAAKLP